MTSKCNPSLQAQWLKTEDKQRSLARTHSLLTHSTECQSYKFCAVTVFREHELSHAMICNMGHGSACWTHTVMIIGLNPL
jgi:hypothetical protein